MNLLIVDGWTEKSGDWKLTAAAQAAGFSPVTRECDENWDAEGVTRQDLFNCDVGAAYSLGCASVWARGNGLVRTPGMRLFVAVLACLDWLDGQIGADLWHRQPWMERVLCFQIDDAFPKSNAFHDSDAVNLAIDDLAVFEKITAALKNRGTVNVDCRALWPQGTDPLTMHTQTQNRPEIINLIIRVMQWLQTIGPTVPGGS